MSGQKVSTKDFRMLGGFKTHAGINGLKFYIRRKMQLDNMASGWKLCNRILISLKAFWKMSNICPGFRAWKETKRPTRREIIR